MSLAKGGSETNRIPDNRCGLYQGIALLPAAGVSIGLALLAERAFPTFGAIIYNGILASVIINELIAPPLVKYAIFKAGEQKLD